MTSASIWERISSTPISLLARWGNRLAPAAMAAAQVRLRRRGMRRPSRWAHCRRLLPDQARRLHADTAGPGRGQSLRRGWAGAWPRRESRAGTPSPEAAAAAELAPGWRCPQSGCGAALQHVQRGTQLRQCALAIGRALGEVCTQSAEMADADDSKRARSHSCMLQVRG